MKVKKFVIGIDPGLSTGGVAFLPEDYSELKVYMTPRIPSTSFRSTGSKSGYKTVRGDIDLEGYSDLAMDRCVSFMETLEDDEKGFILFVVEDVHNIRGVSSGSNFDFGERKGEVREMGYMLRSAFSKMFPDKAVVIVKMVSPKIWQKHSVDFTDKSMMDGKGKFDTKAASIKSAMRHFPGISFTKGRGKVPQDGMTDAALIAKYGMEVLLKSME